MTASELSELLSLAYDRAVCAVDGADRPSVRRAFRRAVVALTAGDPRPGILLVYRWP